MIELVSVSPRQAVAAEVESVDSTPTDVEQLTVQGLPDSEEHLTPAVMQSTDETELVMATTGCLIPAACKQTHITLCMLYSNKHQFSSIHSEHQHMTQHRYSHWFTYQKYEQRPL